MLKLFEKYEKFSVPVWVADSSSNFIYFNKSWLNITDTNLEQAKGYRWFKRIHPDDVEQYKVKYFYHFKEYAPFTIRYRLRCKNGEYRWFFDTVIPHFDSSGSFYGYTGIVNDITEQKNMEKELEESRDRYKTLYINAQVGLYRSRLSDGRILEANERLAHIFGYEKVDEIVGKINSRDLYVDPEQRDKMLDELKRKGEIKKFEARLMRRDGSICWVRYTARLIRDKGCMEGVLIDITEEKEREEEIRKLSSAVEQSSSVVVITDTEGRIEYVNPKFEKVTGYSREEVVGKTTGILKSEKTDPEKCKKLWKTILSGKEWKGEFLNKRKNGEYYWEYTSISPIRNDEGEITHFVAVKEDITERKKTEDILQHQAYHDPLTGLPNRLMFMDKLYMLVSESQRSRQKFAVMFMDLDRFKLVNDTLGHDMGDKLLIGVAVKLKEYLRKGDIIARIGGDEFTLLLPGIKDKHGAARVGQKIVDIFKEPWKVDTHELYITTSIGISIFPYDGQDVQTLMKNADMAMYSAKEGGRNAYRFYDLSMSDEVKRRFKKQGGIY